MGTDGCSVVDALELLEELIDDELDALDDWGGVGFKTDELSLELLDEVFSEWLEVSELGSE